MKRETKYRAIFARAMLGGALLASSSFSAFAADVTLSFLVGNVANEVAVAEQLKKDFEALHPDIAIEIEYRPSGAEGDNIVKTRIATGDMPDMMMYNSGSLLQALNPSQTMVDLSGEASQANILDSFRSVVSADGGVYGVPVMPAMAGGILYNKSVYKDLGLSIPKSWADFMANNAAIKAAGVDPVIQSFGTTWTSQLFVLADYYNVQVAEPAFAADYTANKAKYASTPAALRGFEVQQEIHEAGFLNSDYASTTFDDALRKLANGEGAHYPMLTFAIGALQTAHPGKEDDIGFFALPGPDAAHNGVTVWMPLGIYLFNTSEHQEEAKLFLDYVASIAGCDSQTASVGVTGPYMVKGCELPEDVLGVVADMMPYFEQDGSTAPALEFLSPIKGPLLEQITVEVGSGIRSAADGAALYDEDVRKQALQLGVEGWN